MHLPSYKISTMQHSIFIILLIGSLVHKSMGQAAIYDSGGMTYSHQAAYDTKYYDLSVQVFPEEKSIAGQVSIHASCIHPLDVLVIDLDTLFQINAVKDLKESSSKELFYERDEAHPGKVWIDLGRTYQPGENMEVSITYSGSPREAPRPPWDGGFTWTETADGSPWIATSCQLNGSDIWWPSKDHVSDEPDSMAIHIRVPSNLIAASNGRLIQEETHNDGTTTFHWFVSNPINTYNVALNIAPYQLIEGQLDCVDGSTYPVTFWVLPEDYEKGLKLFPEILDHLRFYEKLLGPYPFRADKYGVAQTPHLGMEHQTIIAYGANFDNTRGGLDYGFDWLHHHELGHEWWGNLVTCSDWRDMWIHESFDGYMQALYMEHQEGPKGATRYFSRMLSAPLDMTVAPMAYQTIGEIYQTRFFSKGAWALHSLRFLMGDDPFFQLLRRMCYPDPGLEKVTDGRQTRFASTKDFVHLAESIYGASLDWFFSIYLRQPALPELLVERNDDTVKLSWVTDAPNPFEMPIEVRINDEMTKLKMTDGEDIIKADAGATIYIDPNLHVLFKGPRTIE